MNTQECYHCGTIAHDTASHQFAASLDGAKLGRRAGYRTAQSQAGKIAMNSIPDAELAIKIYNAIMDLEDSVK